MKFIDDLTLAFEAQADSISADAMAKYMKGHFPFLGLRTELRRKWFKEVMAIHKDEVENNFREIALVLYNKPEREFHYCAIEILMTHLKGNFKTDDIDLLEHLLITNSWWDSVDTISKYLVGGFLKQYPEKTEEVVQRFSSSKNIWLKRAAILFQLGYKKDTDEKLLLRECEKHKSSKEFFIQKAIGWALREYAKTDPNAVKAFVATANLKPLSTREALKNL
ncbi:MAG: DNA alkylation repair protein [Flavobacterium sp.]|nr:MAG: DNA alkylation repair protein [Flavobacterium sp.]